MSRIRSFFISSFVHILLVIIPSFLFCIFILIANISLTRQNIEKLQFENLKKVTEHLSYTFSRLENHSINVYMMLADIIKSNIQGIDDIVLGYLSEALEPDPGINADMSIFAYIPGNNFVYTREGNISYSNFEKMHEDMDMPLSRVFTNLNTATRPVLLGVGDFSVSPYHEAYRENSTHCWRGQVYSIYVQISRL